MDENKLIDKLNSLQAQNFALMHGMAALICNQPLDRTQLRREYDAMCAKFQVLMIEQHEPNDLVQQRIEFARIGNVLFGAS